MGKYTGDTLDVLETLDGDMGLEALPLDTLQGFIDTLNVKLTDRAKGNKENIIKVLRYHYAFRNR